MNFSCTFGCRTDIPKGCSVVLGGRAGSFLGSPFDSYKLTKVLLILTGETEYIVEES